jgi:hypothetical protein
MERMRPPSCPPSFVSTLTIVRMSMHCRGGKPDAYACPFDRPLSGKEKSLHCLHGAGKYFLGGLKGPNSFYPVNICDPCVFATPVNFFMQ